MDMQPRNGMVVQVIRPPQGGVATRQLVQAETGTRYYVQPTATQGRSLTMASPAQRLTATTNRLGSAYNSSSVPQYAMSVKRPFTSDYSLEYSIRNKYPRSVDKNRGLRHFSTKVCEKVKEKGQTNYNEVADELVAEYFDSLPNPPTSVEKQQYDMKNIRRRVYDALNVLMAMNIIEKEKKEIRWVGLPTSSLQECRRLEDEKAKRQERIRHKTEQLQELIIQLVAYKSLVQRNREREREEGRPADSTILYLPYIIVNTDRRTNVDCAISADKTEYLFNFDQPFEIHDDIEVLKRLGLSYGLEKGMVDPGNHDAIRSCLPPALREYANQIIEGTLCGGVVSQAAKGPQTVTISAGQTGQKGALRMAPLHSHAIGRSPATIPVPRMGQAPARYAVVPRAVPGTARYTTATVQQSPMYRTQAVSAPQVKYVTQTQVAGPSRIQGQSYTIQRTGYNHQQMYQPVEGDYVEEIYEDENLQYHE